jgi:hypothetical protein
LGKVSRRRRRRREGGGRRRILRLRLPLLEGRGREERGVFFGREFRLLERERERGGGRRGGVSFRDLMTFSLHSDYRFRLSLRGGASNVETPFSSFILW